MALQYKEIGKVKAVKDCIVTIDGLHRCIYGQLVKFGYETLGTIIGFNEREVQVLILKETEKINPGDTATASLEPFNAPVGKNFIGRIVNILGEPLDGEAPIAPDDYYPIFRKVPTVLERAPVDEPMQTGVKLIDAVIPVGKGQRELILGDKMTGKTTICTDAILNQKGKNVVCIYCCVGKSRSQLAKVVELFKAHGAFEYTIIVAATASASSGQQYLAPYVACSLGDYFMYNKGDVLAVFDDFTKHAWAYRQISLLLGRAPGRGAYPGDVFYLHSRMIERAAKLNDKLGGGSMTFLPIIETLESDLTAYVPTNLVSMTDGQIFTSSSLFSEGFKPAVHIGLSVSRVGSKAQWPIIKKLSGGLRLDYIQYKELVQTTKLQTEIPDDIKRQLKKGEIMVSFITQDKDAPVSLIEQVFLFYAYKSDMLLDLSMDDIETYKSKGFEYISKNNPQLIKTIEEKKKLEPDIEEGIKKAIAEYIAALPSRASAERKAEEIKEAEEALSKLGKEEGEIPAGGKNTKAEGAQK
ncbi:MAG: F0F1 ATP synthase subunit alpha [Candidatus Omnitrophica bacterium]|nr:F0F1 ATP synthase subunit alpha [Candidatus Omnitrophota bacterium]